MSGIENTRPNNTESGERLKLDTVNKHERRQLSCMSVPFTPNIAHETQYNDYCYWNPWIVRVSRCMITKKLLHGFP